jgi:type II secretory pathway component PulF
MPTFHYTAKRGPHDVVEGRVEAADRGGALAYLSQLGYVPVRVSEQAEGAEAPPAPAPDRTARPGRVPGAQLTIFTRQFASLIRSAVPLLRALKILEDQTRHAHLRHVLHELAEEVRQGQTLSSGMARFPQVFTPLYVNLVHSGEISGALDAILGRLTEQMEQEEAMRAKVRMAFTYPAFVGVVGCGTVVFLMTFVMPRLSRLLGGLGDRLPLPTRLLLTVAGWMSSGWFWAAVVAGVAALALLWRAVGPRGRWIMDRCMLRVPLLGPLVQQVELARFLRSFGLQIHHGIPILQAMDVAVQVVSHRVIRSQLGRVPEGLRQGSALSTCLKPLAVGTPFLVNTLAVGEESGKVGEASMEVAAYYERDAERLLQTMASLLEPMLIVGVGLVVGFIVLAVLLPIFEMSAVSP